MPNLPDPLVVKGENLSAWGVQRNFEHLTNRFPLAASTDNFQHVPQAKVTLGGAGSPIGNGVVVTAGWGAETYDISPNNDQHDNVTNNSRLTCRVAGLYVVGTNVQWGTGTSAGRTQVEMFQNAVRTAVAVHAFVDFGAIQLTDILRLNVGDFATVTVFQSSGGSVTMQSASTFWWSWLSPL